MDITYINNKRLALLLCIAAVLGLAIGLLIGGLAINSEDDKDGVFLPGAPSRLLSDGDPDIWQMIHDGISAKNIEDNLRIITQRPHIAGSQADYDLVKVIRDRWEADGLRVQNTPYDVLLSYPSQETPNSVRLLDSAGRVVYDSVNDESDISNQPGVVPPFHGYSPKGLEEGHLVFANYGLNEDFDELKRLGIDVTGKLVIVKYGRSFRGHKVVIAAERGAAGVIIYTDPYDYTGQQIGDDRVYPDTWWLPPGGAQRGTVFTGSGDPLTPGHPANSLAYRHELNETKLPPIPSHPIGYGAAYHILKAMAGDPVPRNWQGGLNFTYRLGPRFTSSRRIQLNVTNVQERKLAENVFGIIPGTIEPDRYVLLGNHRDAWIYGALDPSSGTAIMLEVSRVMAGLVREGKWKPRRSIMFCSWGAEEYGLLGSTEWVEQYVATLRERAVAYINVDTAVIGNDTFRVLGTPLLYHQTYEAAKKTKNPNPKEIQAGRESVYDTWLYNTPWVTPENKNLQVPVISPLGSGSDYAPLIQKAGITSVDLRYSFDRSVYKVANYAVYHTEYESFKVVKEQFDKDFKVHKAVGDVAAEMIRALSDSLVIPLKVKDYATALERFRKMLDSDYGQLLRTKVDKYGDLEKVITNFTKDAEDFENRMSSIESSNPYVLRQINDQLIQLERAFLSPDGLPLRPLKKHLIIAENAYDLYSGSSFPGLVDLLFQIDQNPSRWPRVRQHFAVLLQTIQAAGCGLRDVTRFMVEWL